MLLWKRYGNNKMAAMRYYVLHLQQYSHRLNLLYFFLLKRILLGEVDPGVLVKQTVKENQKKWRKNPQKCHPAQHKSQVV